MKDRECVDFLQWALPQLHLRWPGFRRVRQQVCKRIRRRLQELGLTDIAAYRTYLAAHPAEWTVVDTCCRITISRFYRDRTVFDALGRTVFPELARTAIANGESKLRCWSAGCASGEEAYTLKLIWHYCLLAQFPGLSLHVVATDIDDCLLERARNGCYRVGSLKDLPSEWLSSAFTTNGKEYCVKPALQEGVNFIRQDIRTESPDGLFHLILCRNLAFTYFETALQRQILQYISRCLVSGGVLVIGGDESLPLANSRQPRDADEIGIYRWDRREWKALQTTSSLPTT
jgi:chemotaxis protein methyltransferase CheR